MARLLTPVLAVALATVLATPAMAGDAAAGAKVFKANCAICHATVAGAPSGVGPNLAGVTGRKAGTLASFKMYSPALKGSGLTWSADSLGKYLANPQKAIPGNRMPFAGLHDPAQVSDVVAYLATVK